MQTKKTVILAQRKVRIEMQSTEVDLNQIVFHVAFHVARHSTESFQSKSPLPNRFGLVFRATNLLSLSFSGRAEG